MQIFDHLVNKQPVQISVNLFTKYDPFQILLINQSLKLTDFSDCVEAIRFIGSSKLETLLVLEQMNYEIGFNEDFLYYLKIQLLVVHSKLVYYHTRSKQVIEVITETKTSITQILAIMSAYKMLNYLLKLEKLNNVQCVAVRNAANFLRKYCNENIEKEPFKTAAENLKPTLMQVLKKSDAKIKNKKLQLEVCNFCEEVLNNTLLKCSSKHQMKRCIVTYFLTPLDCNNFCRQCKESVTTLDNLTQVLGNSPLVNDFYYCPFCDTKLSLNE